MESQENLKDKIQELEDSYFESNLLWEECSEGGDPYSCADFISGCLDIIYQLQVLLIEQPEYKDVENENIFNLLYNIKKLSTDYTEIEKMLSSIEIVRDYAGIEYIDGEADAEDIASSIEELFYELKGLE